MSLDRYVTHYTYKYIKHILNNNALLFRIIINYKILRCVVASYRFFVIYLYQQKQTNKYLAL